MFDRDSSDGWSRLIGCVIAVVVILVFVSSCLGEPLSERLNVRQITGTVTDTYIKRTGDNDIFYAAVTQANGEIVVVQNHDAWTWGKTTSADVQQQLIALQKSGQPVTLTVTGWRVPLFSWFENITQVIIQK